MQVQEVKKPVPGPGRLRIKLIAAGVNPVDTYLRAGAQGYRPSLPYTPGIDGAGTVDEIGEGVIGFSPGMKVYVTGTVTGTYAEYCLCSPTGVFPLPENLNWSEGASLGIPYFTAARALFTLGHASPGEIVFVHGSSGGVGLACLQLAAGNGLEIYGTAGSDEGRSLVLKNGASACFNHNDSEYLEAFRETLRNRAVDLVVEMRAELNLENDFKLLSSGGRIVVVGSRGRIEIAPRDIMTSEITVTGLKGNLSTAEDRRVYSSLIAESAGSKKLRPPIAAAFPMERAGKAHKQVMKGPHYGNIVLEISE